MPTTAEILPVPDTILQTLDAQLVDVKQLTVKNCIYFLRNNKYADPVLCL